MAIDIQALIRKAAAASTHAYCPYSDFKVGAALAVAPDTSIPGVNVENASYGLTCCAERNAFAHAVAQGWRRFSAIAIVSSGTTPPLPCGACLQVMAEFCTSDFSVATATLTDPGSIRTYRLAELLPNAFTLDANAADPRNAAADVTNLHNSA